AEASDLIQVSGLKSGPIETSLATDALRGSLYVEVASAAGLGVGQMVRIYSQEWFDTGSGKKTYETNRVRGIDGSRVYLDVPLLVDFTAAGDTAGGGDGVVT